MDSGFLGASAGLLGKLAFKDFSWEINLMDSLWRVPFIIGLVLCNSLMISRYVKSLETAKSVVQVQAINFTTNFLTSVLFGASFFKEGLDDLQTTKWWIGALCMIAGVCLLRSDSNEKLKN
jgi:drug/metabolite transporter (DMT)-like permease